MASEETISIAEFSMFITRDFIRETLTYLAKKFDRLTASQWPSL